MDTTHLHLLLNHVPTIGFVVALGFYVVSFIGKSDHIRQASLALMVGIAFLTIPTYVTGNAAWEAIESMDDMRASIAETHEGAAFLALVCDPDHRGAGVSRPVVAAAHRHALERGVDGDLLFAGVVSFILVAGAANLGGELRHTEIRPAAGERDRDRAAGPHRGQLRARHAVDVGDRRNAALRRAVDPHRRAGAHQPAAARVHEELVAHPADAAAAVGHGRLRHQRHDRDAVLRRRRRSSTTTTRRSSGN